MSSASEWSFVVYLTQVVPRQVNALALNCEVPFIISNKNAYRVKMQIPLQLVYFRPGSGFSYHHSKVSAARCGAIFTVIVLAQFGAMFHWCDFLSLRHMA